MLIRGYFAYFLFPLLGLGVVLGGGWPLLPVAMVYVVVPLLDAAFSQDLHCLQLSELSVLQKRALRFAPVGFCAGYVATVAVSVLVAATASLVELLSLTVSMGVIGSIAITAGHELIHKRDPLRRWVARATLLCVAYPHFEIFHLRGHHRDAATLQDNHTAWKGEGFYGYLMRTFVGGLRFSIYCEASRLASRSRWERILRNRMVWYAEALGALAYLIFFWAELYGFLFFLGQAVIAVLALEAVSYLQHYGMLRTHRDGRWVGMADEHSWDSYHRFSNYLTFMLPRHAAHHAHPGRDYFLLGTNDRSPRLQIGYPVAVLTVMTPYLRPKLLRTTSPGSISTY